MSIRILQGDVREKLAELPSDSFDCIVTSPPYWGLRDYGTAKWEGGATCCDHSYFRGGNGAASTKQITSAGTQSYQFRDVCGKCGARRIDNQIGLEPTLTEYLDTMVAVCRELRRVLKPSGVMFLNIGDSYAGGGNGGGGSFAKDGIRCAEPGTDKNERPFWKKGRAQLPDGLKAKDLCMVPNRLAIRLQEDGWWVRSEIIWAKSNPMPESVRGSHFSRHMVTIADYERLSGLPYIDERAGDDWAGDVPPLSEVEVPRSKAPLSAERERQGNGSRSGRASGCARETAVVSAVGAGQEESGDLCRYSEGQGDEAHDKQEIPGERAREAKDCGEAPSDKGFAAQDRANSAVEREICQVGKDGGEKAEGLCEAEGRRSSRYAVHSGNVARHGDPAQEPLLLLQEAQSADARPRNPIKQGRSAHSNEHCSRLSGLQLEEEQQTDASRLVGCPGCDKCARHHGYIFHLSAGRPTSSYEKIWLLTKNANYWYDADAIKEESVTNDPRRPYGSQGTWELDGRPESQRPNGKLRASANRKRGEFDGKTNALPGREAFRAFTETRNARNVWTIATQPYSEAHFATFPPELAERCIKAGCPVGGHILDPFGGAGTTGMVADRLGRDATLIELNPAYVEIIKSRIAQDAGMFAQVAAE